MTDTSIPPEPEAPTVAIDYDRLAEAMVRQQEKQATIVQLPTEPGADLGPYPHTWIDGQFQPHLSGHNCPDETAKELAGLTPSAS